jgi:membrane-bound lytic murein transglycosylase B
LRIVDIKLPFGRDKAFIPGALRAGLLPVLFLTALLFFPCQAFADWSPLIDRLAADGFDEPVIRELFSRPELRFDAGPMANKLEELLKKPFKKPAALPSYNPKRVYKGLLKEKMITQAHSYLRENTDLLEDISSHYCVPKEIVVSILLVETRLGEHLGGKYAFNSLASMALSTDLETIRPYLPKKLINKKNEDYARTICRQKADWAYTELKALIDYAQVSGFDPLALLGSIYGAIGLCQFMPSNVLPYGVDADHDGRIDLFAKADALYSIANYLQEHGWKCTMDKPSKARVIFDYNRSSVYVNTVLAVAEKLQNRSRTRQ